MKVWAKKLIIAITVLTTSIVFFSFSCSSKTVSAGTVYADSTPSATINKDSLSVIEALQDAFRSVSSSVLPTVVEIDVVETKTRQKSPLSDIPFFFFGEPDSDDSSREYKQEGLGSGVIVKRHGNTIYVLTNNHVAGSATEISVKLYDGRVFKGKLVGADERKDIALVSFESDDKSIPVAVLGDSDTVQTGDICFAMGTPLGYFSSVTQGIVSATGRTGSGIGNINDFIQTDAAINQGNSGGPLVNIYGEIIGINTWIASQSGGSQGLGFSIPINNIKKPIEDFIKNGKVTYGWLGVSISDLTDVFKEEIGVKGKNGTFAIEVYMDSPADKAGIKPGDYIIELNGKPVKTQEQLVRDIGDLTVGEEASFKIIRTGKEIALKAKIDKRDDSSVSDNSKLWPGFTVSPITDEIRTQGKIDKNVKGVIVYQIQAKTPGAFMGLQNYDVITAVNDVPVKNLKEYFSALNDISGKEIWFDISRDGRKGSTIRYKFK